MTHHDGRTNGTGNGRATRRSKENLLDLAVELANEATPGGWVRHHAVAHVSLAAVANAAGVTRGALYRLWPTQEDFWNDLVELILAEDSEPSEVGSTAPVQGRRHRRHSGPQATTTTPTPPMPWIEGNGQTDHLVDTAQDLLLLDPAHLLRAGVVGYPDTSASGNGDLSPWRAAARVEQFTDHMERGLAAGGIRCRDGLTPTHVATAMVAIGKGLPIIGRLAGRWELNVDESSFAAEPGAPRSLFGVALAAISTELTFPSWEPAPLQPASAEPSGREERRRPRNDHDDHDDEPPDDTRGPSGRRRDYLQLAATLVTDGATASDGLSRAVGHVTLDGLARAAGVTRQTLTNVWPDQTAFRLDLFSHLLTRERRRVSTAIADATAKAMAAVDERGPNATGPQVVRGIGDQIHAALEEHLNRISFLAYAPFLASRELADTAQRRHDELLDDTARQLVLFLRTIDRQPRRGITWRQIALALFTLVDGMNRLLRTSPDLVDGDIVHDNHKHTLTGITAAAILTHMTEAADAHVLAEDFVTLVS